MIIQEEVASWRTALQITPTAEMLKNDEKKWCYDNDGNCICLIAEDELIRLYAMAAMQLQEQRRRTAKTTAEYEVWQIVYQLSNTIRKLKYNNEKVDETVLWKLEDIEQELMNSTTALANMEKMRRQAEKLA